MPIHIPSGGFFVAHQASADTSQELSRHLSGVGALVHQAAAGGPTLAAWNEISGQGLWVGEGGAVAYDVDLTNTAELTERLGLPTTGALDPGELLWRLHQQLGPEFLDHLRGAFGFALWNAEQRQLLVATDPYGIRPVVYAEPSAGLIAASRIRHLMLHPGVDPDLDSEAIYSYLFFSAIPSPLTIYKQCHKLEPGCLICCSNSGTRQETYYDIKYRSDVAVGESYWRRSIPLEVRRAVGRFTPLSESDVTGCFLSGGTDSSSIAGYYTQLADRPAKTFTIGFDEPGYNELDFAHIAVRHFGTEQHDHYVTPEDVLSLVEALPGLYDEPFGNSSVVPAYFCARFAKEHGVEVMLAGDGGDEIFGGNERYVSNLIFQRYGGIPRVLRAGFVEPLLRFLPGVGPIHKAQRYLRRANMPNPERFFSYNLLAETPAAQVFRGDYLEQVDLGCFLDIARTHYRAAAPAHDTDRLLYLDMKFTITDNDLRKVTQMGEAAGVRIRYPLLDRDLVDFTATIPAELKVKPGRGRYMFKEAMRGFLPDAIIDKTKHGFGLPIGPWFKKHQGLSTLLNDTVFAPDARITQWLRPEFLAEMKRGFEGVSDSYYGSNFWVFLMLEMWLRRRRNAGTLGR